MILRLVAFTRAGAHLCGMLTRELTEQGHNCTAYAMPRHAQGLGLLPLEQLLAQWTKEAFSCVDGLIFVSACGIAVRACAPYLKSKTQDPAVVSIDDKGRFVVPLVSGHIGGANALAAQVAQIAGAQCVISTATDGGGLFAVDSWAVQNGLHLTDMTAAKRVSAALLDGDPVGLASDFPLLGFPPEGIAPAESGAVGICISLDDTRSPFACTLGLIPRIVTVGVGCRKGVSAADIEAHVLAVLRQKRVSIHALAQVCSIDIKAQEQGLLGFCAKYKLPLYTYSAAELAVAEGEFTPSDFVRGVTGVDNVCERAAVLGGGRILAKKQGANGVTAALALRDWSIGF